MPEEFEATNHRIGPVEIIGQSPHTREMLDFIYKAAAQNFPVLLEGESGAGKEVMAKAIHYASARASGPFIAVNCGAIYHELIESELFGHEKGAFTGAIARKPGRFERANGGTLFLDEIGELPLQDQVKLLRALQEHRIERVGGTEEIPVDVRIMAATNRNLLEEVRNKNFREDLYYRLDVMPFTVPPLRDRPEDILPLARHFLALHCERMNRPTPSLTAEAEAALLQYHWPGNVRELENVIERALAFDQGETIKVESLSFQDELKSQSASIIIANPQGHEGDESLIPENVKLDDLALPEKREAIKRAIQLHYGNRKKAARSLDLSRFQLYRLMKKLGISVETEDKQ
ncbi:MAG: sigma-54 interaction domain-containing protein [Blastocatellia bacterium]